MKSLLQEKKIGVIYGGPSSEREISIRSANNVMKALEIKNYNAVKIDLDTNITENIKKEGIDMAYIILHGQPGEDGSIQGLLDLLDIPYTGSGILGSAVAMNKIITKQLFSASGIPTPPYCIISEEIDWTAIDDLGYPVIFKPHSEGSSIGIEKFDSKEEAEKRLPELISTFSTGVVEKFISGREITVGVIDEENGSISLPLLELIPKNEFYDFEAKYTQGLTEFICPAKLEKELEEKIKRTAIQAHKILWCKNVSRVDFIYTDTDIYVLEVNTIPGMTDTSDLPAEAKAMGIDFPDLVEKILINSWKYHGRKRKK